ncbi:MULTISPECIES: acyltransferase [unclassified Mesorhizobium]|uniref:acyltransferase family protein n=1 Tax=unclassified Mesorhizobium TaxID=325217 RepID=UPI00333B2B9C
MQERAEAYVRPSVAMRNSGVVPPLFGRSAIHDSLLPIQATEDGSARIELPGLLAMRCYAALAVLLVHLITLPKLPIPAQLSFIPTHLIYGVPLFYVVSAFGLFVRYSGRIETQADLRDFYTRRFFRIAPLFYFMMFIVTPPLFWLMWGVTFSISQFVSSGLFIFNFVPQHVTGFVLASWSIGIEMAFYAILPLLVFAITNFRRSLAFVAVSVFFAANWELAFSGASPVLATFEQYSLFTFLFYFAAGISGSFAWKRLRRTAPQIGGTILTASLLGILGLIGLSDPVGGLLAATFGPVAALMNALWALALTGAVVGVCLQPPKWFVNPAATLIGNASFSVYLWHCVVIVILDRLGVYHGLYVSLDGAFIPFFACMLTTLAVVLPLSVMSYRHIERPGMNLAGRFTQHRPLQ